MTAKTNLVLDLVLAAAFLAATNPPLTGMTVHEWLGLAFAAAMMVHLLFHWDWMSAAVRHLFARRGQRLKSLVDLCLFVAFTAAVVSGVLISREVLPAMGLPASSRHGWRAIHDASSNAAVLALALHLGLNWNWVQLHTRRLLGLGPRESAHPQGAGVPAMEPVPGGAGRS
jgi:hypothetical protein